jgi:hypothetical protein
MTHDERNSGRSPRNIAAVLLILAFVMLAIAFRDRTLFADDHAEFLTEAATKAVMGKLAAPTSRPVTWP